MHALPKIKIFTSLLFILLFCSLFSSKYAHAVSTSGTWELTNPMGTARLWHTATLLNNGKVLIVGGHLAGPSAEIYDPLTKTWNQINPAEERWWHTATKLNDGRVLVTGGVKGSSQITIKTTEIYDPETNTWSSTGQLNTARESHNAVLLPNGKVLVAGGYNGSNLNTSEIYDPSTGIWTNIDNMAKVRCCGTMTLLDKGNALISGGNTVTTEIYNSSSNNWTDSSSMNVEHSRHVAIKLQNGKVIVAGGTPSWPNSTKAVEIYDPTLNSWYLTGDMNTPRAYFAGTLLNSGSVLVSGGATSYTDPQISSEIYDSTTETWKTTEQNMNIPRLGHTSTLLENGKVLVTGGSNGNNHNIKSKTAEIFTLSSVFIDVTHYTQNHPFWAEEEYDFASEWSPNDTGIGSWGCALTTAVMILHFYGYEKLPSGAFINPSTLNNWLKNQKDGFIGNGLVSWDAIKRLTVEAKEINSSPYTALDMEWQNRDEDQLTSNLENDIPTILEVNSGAGSHFVVANGITGDTFNIVDPLGNNEFLTAYNDEFTSTRVFTPSNTDLSAIKIITNEDIEITVKDENGIEQGFSYVQKPLANANSYSTSGENKRIFYLTDPETENYSVSLSTDSYQKYEIDIYTYGKYADVKQKTYKGFLVKNSNNEFNIEFNKDKVEDTKINRKRALGKDK